MAVASISQKTSCAGVASARPCRVARASVVVKASKKNNVESAMQAVGTQAVSAALAVAMCVMAPAPAQALLPFRADYQAQLDNAASSVKNKVSNDINTKSAAKDVKSAVDNKLGNPVDALGAKAGSIGDKIKANLPLGNLPDVGGKVSSDLSNVKSKALDAKGSLDNKLNNPADAVGAKTESTLEKIKSVLPIATLPDVGNKVSSDINNTKSAAKDVKSAVDNKLGNPVDSIGAKASSIGDKIKANLPLGNLPDVGNKVSSDINNTKSAAKDVKSAVDNKLGNPVDSIGAKAGSIGDKIKANLPLGNLPDVGSKVQSDINTTQNKASEVKGAVQNQVQNNSAGNALGDAADGVKNAFDNVKQGLSLGNLGSGNANGQGTGEGLAAGKAKEQATQADAAQSGQKVKDFVLGTSYGKQ